MMPVTDDDRRMFPGLTDDQIGDIVSHEGELRDAEWHRQDNRMTDSCARVLRYFGYEGLRDYLQAMTGSRDALTGSDFLHITERCEMAEYARMAQIISAIISAPESSSQVSADRRSDIIHRILEPLKSEE